MDFAATAKFYRYLDFDIAAQDERTLHLRRGTIEFLFTARAIPLAWDEDRIAVIMVSDVAAWREVFARTRMGWKAMGRPSLTRISDGAWGVPAFNVSDRDGNMIWAVQRRSQLSEET